MTEMSYLNVRVLSSNRAKRPNKGPERLSRRHCCNLYTSIRQIQYHLMTHCSALFHVISLCVRVCSGLHKCLCARVHHPDCWQCWNRRKIQHLLYLHGFVSVWTSASSVFQESSHRCRPLFAQSGLSVIQIPVNAEILWTTAAMINRNYTPPHHSKVIFFSLKKLIL